MKKFLRLDLPFSGREIPPETDAAILAAAAMRAKSSRKKRMIFKLAFPGVAAAAAAATAISITLLPELPGRTDSPAEIAKYQTAVLNAHPTVEAVIAPSELLALADTSSLEQESYNLAVMTDFSMDEESFII